MNRISEILRDCEVKLTAMFESSYRGEFPFASNASLSSNTSSFDFLARPLPPEIFFFFENMPRGLAAVLLDDGPPPRNRGLSMLEAITDCRLFLRTGLLCGAGTRKRSVHDGNVMSGLD